jgi:hypothetical protein
MRYGEDEAFKAKLSEAMIERAAEIGDWSMVREVLEVAGTHIECCRLPAETPIESDDLTVNCAHDGGRVMSAHDGGWHCALCYGPLP